MDERLYTPQDIQQKLRKKNIRTIYRYIKSGRLKATRISNRFYVKEHDLEDFLQMGGRYESRY